jgi:DNA-binding SARP family transcriptional activator
MSQLFIKVLGVPEVYHEERALKFRSRKVLALLLYLAIEGRRVTRERISSMFWPESEESAARATLRRTLADLRSALDDSPVHTHLLIERDALGFASIPGDQLDMRIVDEAFALLCSFPDIGTPEATGQTILCHLQQAMQASRGSFMEGFSLNDAPDFEDWVGEQRAVWQRRMGLIYERLAQMQAEQGNTAGAIETAYRWLAHDPLQELAYQRLMLLYLHAGNYRAALNVYEHCCKVLAGELCIHPLPETQAIAGHIHQIANDASDPIEPSSQLLIPALSRTEQANESALIADVEWHLAQLGF